MKETSLTKNTYRSLFDLEDCIAESQTQPVLILKYSATCPISAMAKNEVDAFLKDTLIPVYWVVVQQERPLSNQIASTFKVNHESPQLLLVRDGSAKIVLNHQHITVKNIKKSLTNL